MLTIEGKVLPEVIKSLHDTGIKKFQYVGVLSSPGVINVISEGALPDVVNYLLLNGFRSDELGGIIKCVGAINYLVEPENRTKVMTELKKSRIPLDLWSGIMSCRGNTGAILKVGLSTVPHSVDNTPGPLGPDSMYSLQHSVNTQGFAIHNTETDYSCRHSPK